ncbi:MAG: ABC transporter ATP-binding protein [Actinomycetota bacterium]
MSEPAIRTLGLTKFYGRHRGIENVDLVVERGEVFGFLGPNGAGKSTTIRLLLDLLRPTAGAASVLGLDPRRDAVAVRSRVGYLPGDLSMYGDMTGRQLCTYFAALRGLDTPLEVEILARRFDLDLDRRIGDYSTGNRQKVGLVQALMHEPELLILDEPTSGLDPLMQQEFYAVVDEIRNAGRTVFLSSHLLPEVEKVADRVAIIRNGRLVVVDEVATLKARAVRRMEIHFGRQPDPEPFAQLDAVRRLDRSDDGLTLILVVEGSIDAVIRCAARYPVHNIVSHDGDLEDVFLDYYRGGSGQARVAAPQAGRTTEERPPADEPAAQLRPVEEDRDDVTGDRETAVSDVEVRRS